MPIKNGKGGLFSLSRYGMCRGLPPATGFSIKSPPEIMHQIHPQEYYQSDQKGLTDQKTSATQHITRMQLIVPYETEGRSVHNKLFKPKLILMRLLTVN